MKTLSRREQEGYRLPDLTNLFDVDRFFPSSWGLGTGKAPSVNVAETDREYHVEVFAPGFKKADFSVDVEDDMLHIRAESKQEDKEEKRNYTRKEYHYQSFTRSFRLPENIQDDQVSAKYEDGVLMITIPKTQMEQEKPSKHIDVG
jgi:HSP20 family protein